MLSALSGYRTYLVAIAMAAYAVAGWGLDYHDANKAISLLLEAAAFAGLRAGIKK